MSDFEIGGLCFFFLFILSRITQTELYPPSPRHCSGANVRLHDSVRSARRSSFSVLHCLRQVHHQREMSTEDSTGVHEAREKDSQTHTHTHSLSLSHIRQPQRVKGKEIHDHGRNKTPF
ncbi:hypothetical protein BDP67DRAFT_222860 [Colletotrichum lupini]|nr:hypothetical protein BDP67DRAFT_222860 [Colletotrichum lupini]